jgi:uncharacterized protein YodC (DUF2158 family)
MPSFKPGDVVQLKSGGPTMTVETVGNHGMTGVPLVWCSWFEGKKRMKDTFAPEALDPVGASSGLPISRG